MNNLQEQGRSCYKRGDYKKAIELFDRAIGRSPSVLLLDNRAASYEKLGDLSAALKDAKKTIQLHREDAVGYLRAGRVLVKMEKANVALEIYTHGLKCIKHVGKAYEQLRKVHKELMDRLCPPKSIDPLTVLPRELAETILEYLSFRHRMNACLVSKGWTQFIRSTPNLWSHVDLSGARRKVRTAFISRAINTARMRLKVATLSNLFDFDRTLTALIKHCHLEELILLQCGYQNSNLTSILTQAKTLRSLKISKGTSFNASELLHVMSAQSDRLEVLECWVSGSPGYPMQPLHLPRLTSLSLAFHDGQDHSKLLEAISSSCPALHKLTIRHDDGGLPHNSVINLQDCEELRYLDFSITVRSLQHQLRVPPGLTTLKIDCRFHAGLPKYELPKLEELSVHACGDLHHIECLLNTNSAADLITAEDNPQTKPSDLQSLFVTQAFCGGPEHVERLLSHPRLTSVQTLCLSCYSGMDDTAIAVVATSKLEKLRYLDVSQAGLTGIGVKNLVSSLNLDTLILNDCAKVSPDAVEWARSKGVTVKQRMTSESIGARKLRY